MEFAGKSAIVTGAGQGIGKALAEALSARGVRVLVHDMSRDKAEAVAQSINGVAAYGDLCRVDEIEKAVSTARSAFGAVDMLFSNAGFALGEPDGPTSQDDAHWQKSWDLHVMAYVRAARLVLPEMVARGSGVLVNVASAAGVLSQIGDAAYSATKHAAVSVAQSMAIEHGDEGIQVSVVCPLYVATPLLGYSDTGADERPSGVIAPQDVALATLEGIEKGVFMIFPHPEAKTYFQQRADDTDRWVSGMRRLRRSVKSETDLFDPQSIHHLI